MTLFGCRHLFIYGFTYLRGSSGTESCHLWLQNYFIEGNLWGSQAMVWVSPDVCDSLLCLDRHSVLFYSCWGIPFECQGICCQLQEGSLSKILFALNLSQCECSVNWPLCQMLDELRRGFNFLHPSHYSLYAPNPLFITAVLMVEKYSIIGT